MNYELAARDSGHPKTDISLDFMAYKAQCMVYNPWQSSGQDSGTFTAGGLSSIPVKGTKLKPGGVTKKVQSNDEIGTIQIIKLIKTVIYPT